jgi:hypothetical protein
MQQEHQIALEIVHRWRSPLWESADDKLRYDKEPATIACAERKADARAMLTKRSA